MKQLSNRSSIRRDNTLRLMKEKGLSRHDLSNLLDMKYSLLSAYIGKTPTKSIGDEVSARIEAALDVQKGFLDIDHALISQLANDGNPIWDKESDIFPAGILVPLYADVKASCGPGYLNSDNEESLERIMLETQKVKNRGITPSNVKAFKADGDSMLPIIPHDAQVFVDSSVNQITRDGAIYAVCYGGLLLIKRLFRGTNQSVILRSENPDKIIYPDQVINESEMQANGFYILGQVFHVDFSIPI